jgi:hypothetical protein
MIHSTNVLGKRSHELASWILCHIILNRWHPMYWDVTYWSCPNIGCWKQSSCIYLKTCHCFLSSNSKFHLLPPFHIIACVTIGCTWSTLWIVQPCVYKHSFYINHTKTTPSLPCASMHRNHKKRQLSQLGLACVLDMTLGASITKNGIMENTHNCTLKTHINTLLRKS